MSHLAVLEDAVAEGLTSIAIMEDDANWTPDLLAARADELSFLADGDWDFLHGGGATYEKAVKGPPTLVRVRPDEPIQATHFGALRGDTIRRSAAYLSTLASRQGGDPNGGPMHVDGAYGWFRRDNPEVAAYRCSPGLAYQRSSRTDVHALGFLDRTPITSVIVKYGRRLKNVIRY